jgi:deazaflavin-dependent oxidoreductase (nitroreductase family)
MNQEHDEPVIDSPTGWVSDHIRRYVESDGADGHLHAGVTALLLTTRGRSSGVLRRTALYYGMDDGRYLLVASKGGSPTHPAWYLNLAANPEVTLQVGAEVFAARARTAGPAERPALWEKMAAIFPRYNLYQEQAGREIPVVIVERS